MVTSKHLTISASNCIIFPPSRESANFPQVYNSYAYISYAYIKIFLQSLHIGLLSPKDPTKWLLYFEFEEYIDIINMFPLQIVLFYTFPVNRLISLMFIFLTPIFLTPIFNFRFKFH